MNDVGRLNGVLVLLGVAALSVPVIIVAASAGYDQIAEWALWAGAGSMILIGLS